MLLCLVVALSIRVPFISATRKRWAILGGCLCASLALAAAGERRYAFTCIGGVLMSLLLILLAWIERDEDVGIEVAESAHGFVHGSATVLDGMRGATHGTLELLGHRLRFMDLRHNVLFDLPVDDIQNLKFPRSFARRRGQMQFDAATRHYRINFNVSDNRGQFSYYRSIQIWREALASRIADNILGAR